MSGIIFLGAQPVSLNATPVQIHNATSISATGSTTLTELAVKEISLVVNVLQAPTGLTPSLTFTIHEVDPGNLTTVFGTPQSITLNSIGISELTFPLTGSAALISWTVSGTFPSVNSTISSKFGASSGGGSSGTTNQGDKGTANNSWYVELTDGTTALPIASSVTGTESTLIVRNIPPATQDVNITNSSLSVSVSNSSIPVQLRSEEVNGNNAPTYSTLVGGKDASGKIKPILVDNSGIVYVTGSVSNSSIAQSGQAAPSNCTFIGAVDNNLNLHGLNSDTSGRLFIRPIGTAGTPDTSVMTVQGITNGTPLPVTVSNSITNPSVSLIGQTTPTSITAIGGTDGTNAQIAKIITSSPGSSDTGLVVRNIPSGTQTISGTVDIGTTNGIALDSTLTGGTQKSIIRGGAKGTTSASDVTSEAIDANTQALHVYISGQASSGSSVVSGSGTAGSPATGVVTIQGISGGTNVPVSGSGNFTVVQATASNLNANVSGTVTANVGTTNGLALDTTLTGGTQKTKITDGTNTVALTNSTPVGTEQALIVRNIPSGTQDISGSVSVSNNLSIQGIAGGTPVPVSGSITATNPSVSTIGSAVPSSATFISGTNGTNATPFYIITSAPGSSDAGLVVRNIPSGTQTISGSVTSTISGNVIIRGNGTAGSSDSQVVTVQGISGGTPMPISGSMSVSGAPYEDAIGSSVPPNNAIQIGGYNGATGSGFIGVSVANTTPASNANGLVTRLVGNPQVQISNSVSISGNVPIVGVGSAGSPSGGVVSIQGVSSGVSVPVSISGTSTFTGSGTAGSPATGVVTVQGIAGGTSMPVSVSGTATVTSSTLALDSTLTGGTQKSIVRGGAKGTTSAADVTSTSIDANTQALHVYIAGQSSSGGSIVTGGGTAGTPDTGVLTIQGISSGTPIPVTGSISASNPSVGSNSSTLPTSSTLIGGNDGTSRLKPISVDTNGVVRMTGTGTAGSPNSTVMTVQGISGGTNLPVTVANTASITGTGTAGTPNSGVVTIQGISGGTTVPVSGTVTASNPSVATKNGSLPSSATLIGGTDGATLIPVRTDASGNIILNATGSSGSPSAAILSVQGVTGATAIPVTGSGTFTVTQSTASNLNANVSGTVTANIGTTNGLALNSTLTSGTQKSQITDGTNSAAVSNSAPAGTEQGLITRNIPSGTQAISGTITANVGTTNGLALDATLTGGTQKAILRSGAKGASTSADVTSKSIDADTQALHVYLAGQAGGKSAITGTGTAGTPDTGVVTIQGISSGTPIPVTGSISASNPSVGTNNSTLPTSSTLIGGSDGTNIIPLLIAPGFTPSASSDSALVVTPSPNGIQKIVGTQAAGTSGTTALTIQGISGGTNVPVSGSGNFTVVQATASNLNANVSGTITANIGTSGSLALDATLTGGTQKTKITDGTNTAALSNSTPAGTEQGLIVRNIPSGTQTISGTVTSNIGTTNGLALDSTLTGGTQKSIVRAGAKGTTSAADVTSTSIDANTQALHVYIAGQASSGGSTVTGAGTAGTPDTGVLTIQGISGGTPLPVTGSISASNPSVSTNNSAIPTSSTLVGASDGTNLKTLLVNSSGELKIAPTGTAGTASANVMTVQGIAGGTPLPVTGSISASNPSVGTNGSAYPTSSTLIGGINGSNLLPVTIKSASTIISATDPALVVGISPNNIISTHSNDLTSGSVALAALNAAVTISTYNKTNFIFTLAAGTFIGTFVAETSPDGSTWNSTNLINLQTLVKSASLTFGAANSDQLLNIIAANTDAFVRVRVSAYTSGTANASIRISTGNDLSSVTIGRLNNASPAYSNLVGGVVSSPTYSANTIGALSLTTAGLLRCEVNGANTAGTPSSAVLTIQGNASGVPVPVSGTVTAANASVSATGSSVPASATYLGGTDGSLLRGLSLDSTGAIKISTTSLPAAAAIADAASNPTAPAVDARISALNAARTGWDRIQSGGITSANGTSSVQGFINNLTMTKSVSTKPTITANNYSNLYSTTAGELYVKTELPAVAAMADASANATTAAVDSRLMVLNSGGSTWDRVRSGLTNTATITGVLNDLPLAQYTTARPALTSGNYTNLYTNSRGDLAVSEQFAPAYEDNANAVAYTMEKPFSNALNALTWYDSATAIASAVVKATSGRLYNILCFNFNGATRYLQIFNTTSVPSGGAVPAMTFYLATNTTINISLAPFGKYFSTGITIVSSTTLATYTAGTADLSVNIGYL